MGGQRIVQSQIHFIFFFVFIIIFFTIQVLFASRWKQSVKLIV